MSDIRQIFGKPKKAEIFINENALEMFFQEYYCDFSYDKPTNRPYKCIYVFEAEEDEEEEEEEERCIKCNIPLTEDDINCGDGQNCEDCGYEEDEEEDEDDYEDWSMEQKQYKNEFDNDYAIDMEPATITISIKSYIGATDKEGEYSIKWKNGRYNHLYDDSLKGIKTNIDKKSYFATEVCDLWEIQLEEPVICVKCNRDFSQEIDDRSSFEEIGKIICEKCFLEEDEEEDEEDEDDGFGTAYYDGDGFADCDPQGNGNRLCPNSGFLPSKWCSECVYLRRPMVSLN